MIRYLYLRSVAGAILSVPFFLVFGLLLSLFHPIQVISRKTGGYHAHKRSVDILNLLLIKSLMILGVRVRFSGFETVPADRPLVIVANHQSGYDIPPVIWGFRSNHPKFISKRDLGRYIPSISYNLRHGGSVLIDRSNRLQSVKEITSLGKYISENNYSAAIFPEGTRSRDGRVKRFKTAGLTSLIRSAPDAAIVPLAIKGSRNMRGGFATLPLSFFVIECRALDPVDIIDDREPEESIREVESMIREALQEK